MIIPIELRFKADKDSKSALRTDKTIKSHDVNSVEFHITIDGLELTDNHTAKILSVFHSSESQVNMDCEIVEGKIIYKPDTNLITRHEHVTNYVYVYNGNQSLDVREFIYTVDLSKIDETSLEVKEVYDQSYADLLADFEQALSDYKDNLPQADSVRADIDEILNQFSEDSQAKLSQYDADAQQVIADNQTAFDLAESVRQESYEQTQSHINEAESSRVEAEGNRDYAETSRKANEADRVLAENERQTNETERQTIFETNESERDGTFSTNETVRQENETTRQQAEAQRVSAESSRESAEAQRKIDHANRSAELDGKADKVVLKNLIENGDFSQGTKGWLLESNWSVSSNRLEFEGEGTIALNATPEIDTLDINDTYYLRYYLNTFTGNFETGIRHQINGFLPLATRNVQGIQSHVQKPTDTTFRVRVSLAGDNCYFDNILLINLTETFGAGNEPTKEEMDRLIETTGYIDGEYALNNKEMLGYLMNGIREKANKKQEDWITPTLTNGATGDVQFRKNQFGRVEFRGKITGNQGVRFFRLPTGYQPRETLRTLAIHNTSTNETRSVQIQYSGAVYLEQPYGTHEVYFDDISFIAE